jgi:hypothetical protein
VNDRRGDPTLRARCSKDHDIWAAALAWMVEGARRWYEMAQIMPESPRRVQDDTLEWRVESDLALAYLQEHLVFDPTATSWPEICSTT